MKLRHQLVVDLDGGVLELRVGIFCISDDASEEMLVFRWHLAVWLSIAYLVDA